MTREQAVSLAVEIVIRESRKNGCSPSQQIEEWSNATGVIIEDSTKLYYSRTGLYVDGAFDQVHIVWPIVKKAMESSDQGELKL